ncbi:MAG: hypothetical protein QOI73_2870 [Solirubrobacteraceae bacterium]|nr:hypothetical protein [Solirubrobacteraceae bacterium]
MARAPVGAGCRFGRMSVPGESPAASTCSLTPGEQPRLGVLFVHGMGSHAQGTTLAQFSEPLVEWLANGAPAIARAELSAVALTPGDDEPAHLTCELIGDDASPRHLGTWIMAESCWSNAFTPASYPRIAGWLIGSVPWMLGEYLHGAWRREMARDTFTWFRVVRYPLTLIYAIVGALLAGPVILALLALLTVRVIPIPWLRTLLDKIPRALSESLGDVYVILATHLDRESIRTRIVRDHEWLSARCDTTVVVAHSAGSALTHQLIRDGRICGVSTYVTLGEAIWRMRWMAELSRSGAPRVVALVFAVAGTLLITGGGLALLGAFGLPLWIAIVAFVLGWMLHIASAVLVWERARTEQWRHEAITTLAGRVGRWHDYVASSDPVPAGALTEVPHATALSGPGQPAAPHGTHHYAPTEIRNRRSIVLDHVTYPANLEEFVAGLAGDLAAAGGLELGVVPSTLERAKKARVLRTLTTALVRLCSAAAGATVMLTLAGEGALAALGKRFGWVGDALGTVGLGGDQTAGAAVALVLLVVAWILTAMGCKQWERIDRRRLLGRKPLAQHPLPHFAIAFLWLACTSAAAFGILALAGIGAGRPWIATSCALVLGWLLMVFVKQVAAWRDRAYATPVPSQPPA